MWPFKRLPSRSIEPLPPRRPFSQRDSTTKNAPSGPVLTTGIFTPTQPKSGSRQITGRQAELQRILQALIEDRAHVVLHSERGRGKTSLSNMVVEMLRRADVIVTRYTCDAGSDFDSILRGLARDLPLSLLANPQSDTDGSEGCEAALPPRELRPGDVAALPARLTCRTLVCVIDEFDRVENTRARTQLADAIKQLSDRDVRLQFLIVGVSDNLDEILGQHPSIQRSVLGVHLPLFTDRDVAQLISKASQDGGFSFPPEVVARITVLSRGMPYMAQLIGLRLTQAANVRGSSHVSTEDLATATAQIVAEANPRTAALYTSLTERGRNQDMLHSLRRIASAPQDPWGRMEVLPLADGRISVSGRRIPGVCWERLIQQGVIALGRDETATFANRALMHHVLLLAVNDVNDAAEPSDRSLVALWPVASQA